MAPGLATAADRLDRRPPSPHRWPLLITLVPCLLLAGQNRTPVSMRDVSIRGRAMSAPGGGVVQVILRAMVGTPIGRVPINGHVHIRYDCEARFTGRITYHPLVRLLAKIKGLELVTGTDGHAVLGDSTATRPCPALDVANIQGQASVQELQLSGFVRFDADSIAFRGPAWLEGDSVYHSRLTARAWNRDILVVVNLHEH